MAVSLQFHTDAALAVPVSTTSINHLVDGSSDPQDLVFYLGSVVAANKFENLNDPGVANLQVEISNSTPLWGASIAVTAGSFIRTTAKNGYRYKAQSISGGGLTGATEPTWPTTVGNTVIDNEVIWVNDGKLHEATEIILSLTQAGLDTAVAGDPVSLGAVINGGAGNAVPVYMRIDDATALIGQVSELGLLVKDVQESPI